MSDKQTTLNEIKELIDSFADERDWQQFHSPKNLSMSISIEAAELMEIFQWLSLEEAKKVMESGKKEMMQLMKLLMLSSMRLHFAYVITLIFQMP